MKKVILSSVLAIISFAAIGMEQQKHDIQIGQKELLAKYANTDHEFNDYFQSWFGYNVFTRKVANCNGKHGRTYAEAIHLPNCDHYAIDLESMMEEYGKLSQSDNSAFTKLVLNSFRDNMPKFTDAINSLHPSQKTEKFKLLVTEFYNTINIYSDSVIDTLRENEMSAIVLFALSARDALIECAQLLDNRYFSDSLFPIKELNVLSKDSQNAFLTKTQDCMNQINTGIENLRAAINATKKPKIDYSKTRIGDVTDEKIELPESAQYVEGIRPYAKKKLADFIDLYQEMLIIQHKVKTKDPKFDVSLAENKVNFTMCALHFGDRIAYMVDISRQIKAFQYNLMKELSLTDPNKVPHEDSDTIMLKYPIARYTYRETSFPLNSAVRNIYCQHNFLNTQKSAKEIINIDFELIGLYHQYKALGGIDLPIDIITGDLTPERIQEIKEFSDADKIGMWWNRKISLDQMKIVLENMKKK